MEVAIIGLIGAIVAAVIGAASAASTNDANIANATRINRENIAFQQRTNEEERQFVTQQNELQRQYALEDRKHEEEYNSIANQMEQFRQAGLNPNLVAGKSSFGLTSTNAYSPMSWSPSSPLKSQLPMLSNPLASLANTDFAGAYQRFENAELQNLYIEEQTRGLKIRNDVDEKWLDEITGNKNQNLVISNSGSKIRNDSAQYEYEKKQRLDNLKTIEQWFYEANGSSVESARQLYRWKQEMDLAIQNQEISERESNARIRKIAADIIAQNRTQNREDSKFTHEKMNYVDKLSQEWNNYELAVRTQNHKEQEAVWQKILSIFGMFTK